MTKVKKTVRVGTLDAEELTMAFIREIPARGVFANVVYEALSLFIKNNKDLLLPQKTLDELIETIAKKAAREQLEPFLRQLVQQGKISVITDEKGEDGYYLEEWQAQNLGKKY